MSLLTFEEICKHRENCVQVRIQDFCQEGAQLLRPKIAYVAERSRLSEASYLWLGSRANLRVLEAFGF